MGFYDLNESFDDEEVKESEVCNPDEMSDEEFDEMMENDVLNYEGLSEEEILNRQKEFALLSEEGKEMLKEISGIQNSRYITLNALICNSMKVIQDADDNIEDVEFSEQYLQFMSWYDFKIRQGEFYPTYTEHEMIFEDILNDKLENEDENNIFAYFKKKYIEKIRGISKEIDEPLSSLEEEACKRFEKITTTEVDLVELFNNICSYKGYSWEEFEKLLK